MTAPPTRRSVAIAGHTGDAATAEAGWNSDDPSTRAAALGALERLQLLTDDRLADALADPDPTVRRRAAELAATHPTVDLVASLGDPDATVVEMAAWALGEHESNRPPVVDALVELATGAADALVREAAVAALGAIGDDAAVDAIIAATTDKPAVRRR
ncbi:MAG: hypothetical protein HKN44_16220, partial [Ilumatobacter sp.]|nr:hypothetical protein [Ilumatobacter sp.]